jgi:hypothetical protein
MRGAISIGRLFGQGGRYVSGIRSIAVKIARARLRKPEATYRSENQSLAKSHASGKFLSA